MEQFNAVRFDVPFVHVIAEWTLLTVGLGLQLRPLWIYHPKHCQLRE